MHEELSETERVKEKQICLKIENGERRCGLCMHEELSETERGAKEKQICMKIENGESSAGCRWCNFSAVCFAFSFLVRRSFAWIHCVIP